MQQQKANPITLPSSETGLWTAASAELQSVGCGHLPNIQQDLPAKISGPSIQTPIRATSPTAPN